MLFTGKHRSLLVQKPCSLVAASVASVEAVSGVEASAGVEAVAFNEAVAVDSVVARLYCTVTQDRQLHPVELELSACRVVPRTTTAAWPKWGNWGFAWPPFELQEYYRSTVSVRVFNQVTLRIRVALRSPFIRVPH